MRSPFIVTSKKLKFESVLGLHGGQTPPQSVLSSFSGSKIPSLHDCSSFLHDRMRKETIINKRNLPFIIFVYYICINSKILKIPATYKTLKGTSEGQYKEKGSKFIGIAVYCEDEEVAKEYLAQWRNEHHQARHLCYAYRFGIKKDVYRANDDGEPSNSAGAPILGQIQAYDLTNVLIGVVRYYGGVKLGVGGLINAYRTAAKEAIENGRIITEVVKDRFELFFDYQDMPLIMDVIKSSEASINKQVFENDCYLKIAIKIEDTAPLLDKLKEFNSLKIKSIGTF